MDSFSPLTTGSVRRPLFISPHLDDADAVFACGRLLASLSDAVVATVFAGAPPPGSALTAWDRAAGFRPGDDVVASRRDEDRQALGRLGAWPLWLDLRDRQYGPEPALGEVVSRLRLLLMQCEPDTVFFPLGLFHSDHRITRAAALILLQACPSCRWVAYEDALYRCLPGLRDDGIAALRQAGLALRPARLAEAPGAAAKKRQAVACYRSQLRALAAAQPPAAEPAVPEALAAPEVYWQIAPAAAELH